MPTIIKSYHMPPDDKATWQNLRDCEHMHGPTCTSDKWSRSASLCWFEIFQPDGDSRSSRPIALQAGNLGSYPSASSDKNKRSLIEICDETCQFMNFPDVKPFRISSSKLRVILRVKSSRCQEVGSGYNVASPFEFHTWWNNINHATEGKKWSEKKKVSALWPEDSCFVWIDRHVSERPHKVTSNIGHVCESKKQKSLSLCFCYKALLPWNLFIFTDTQNPYHEEQ